MSKELFTCEKCDALYVCLKNFQIHRQSHTPDIYPCFYCQEFFDEVCKLNLHSQKHKNEEIHSCRCCVPRNNCISDEETRHGRRSIATETPSSFFEDCPENPPNDPMDFEDEVSDDEDETSSQKTPLKGKGKGNRKARLTEGDVWKKFQCHHCGKSFKTKSHLQRHILTHTGEKPYHCNRCDGRFNQSSSLRNHVIALHTKEFPHLCLGCRKGFLMPALLQKHLQQSSKCAELNDSTLG